MNGTCPLERASSKKPDSKERTAVILFVFVVSSTRQCVATKARVACVSAPNSANAIVGADGAILHVHAYVPRCATAVAPGTRRACRLSVVAQTGEVRHGKERGNAGHAGACRDGGTCAAAPPTTSRDPCSW